MATRSHIGMLQENGEIQFIYCHWDGYPSHNGQILLDHYQDEEKVKSLLELGSISVLAPRVHPDEGEEHNFKSQVEGVVVAYHRDRGEEKSPTKICYSEKGYVRKGEWVDYQYLFKEGKWYYSRGGEFAELIL
jgi:hypothetical protein